MGFSRSKPLSPTCTSAFGACLLVAILALCAGCGPVLYLRGMDSAEEKFEQAREQNARWFAPYEYYFAEAHLQEARREAAEASYEDAIRYAKTAETYSARALSITASRRRIEP